MRILVTGATGNIGARVLRGLAAQGLSARASSRKPDQLEAPEGAEVVRADLDDPASLRGALDGIDAVFLYAQPEQIGGFVDAATAAGVRHVVLLSSNTAELGEADPIGARHAAVERALAASGLAATFVRPGMFASNVAAWAQPITTDAVVHHAYGAAQLAPVHPDDIADAAVAALCEGERAATALRLSGPETLTQRRMAELIGEQTGQAVRFAELTEQQHGTRTRGCPRSCSIRCFRCGARRYTLPIPARTRSNGSRAGRHAPTSSGCTSTPSCSPPDDRGAARRLATVTYRQYGSCP